MITMFHVKQINVYDRNNTTKKTDEQALTKQLFLFEIAPIIKLYYTAGVHVLTEYKQ